MKKIVAIAVGLAALASSAEMPALARTALEKPMFYILWDLILLVYLQSNMRLILVIILPVLLKRILRLLKNN